ncbi:MAG: ribonuclease HII, partial [Christensenellales bacterium]
MRETPQEKFARLTQLEDALLEKGRVVAGMDEVGRGPLAGPVVAACISIPAHKRVLGVDDSKKLSEKKRESLYDLLVEAADYCETAFIECDVIDQINILNATRRAMEICAARFTHTNGIILVDALDGLRLPCEARPIIHGDAACYAIAAASIVAKVARDRHMAQLDRLYPEYGFARNKGYGTKEHIEALRAHG